MKTLNGILTNFCLIIIILLSAIGSKVEGQKFDYVFGTDPYPVPDMEKPDKGVFYQDFNFHTSIVRVTDDATDKIPYTGHFIVKPVYSRIDAENADGTFLILYMTESSMYLYDAHTFKCLKFLSTNKGGKIPLNVDGCVNEAMWDDENPNLFYYVYRMGLYKYNVVTDEITLIRDFAANFPADAKTISTDVEGEPSMDRRIWAFIVKRDDAASPRNIALFTYDLVENNIIEILNRDDDRWPLRETGSKAGMNCIAVSPYGDRVIVEWTGTLQTNKTHSYNIHFNDPVKLSFDGHSDLAIDAQGRQVHLVKDDSHDVIAMYDLLTGQRTDIIELPMTGSWDTEPAQHLSANNYDRPGWFVLSTHGEDESWANWQVYMIEMKPIAENPRIWRIADTHGKRVSDYDRYWQETMATINRKGTKIFWGSNWGGSAVDTYQATLPSTWWEDLGNGTGINQAPSPSRQFNLGQNYPNPFSASGATSENSLTTILYSISNPSNVQISIYDLLGKCVRTLVDEMKPQGEYQVHWDGRDANGERLASGVYFYCMQANTNNEFLQKKIMLLH